MCVIEYIEPGQDPKKKKKKVKKNKVDKKENKETPKQAAAREKKEAEKAKKEAEKKQKEEEWKELAKGKQAVSWSPLPDADFIYDIISWLGFYFLLLSGTIQDQCSHQSSCELQGEVDVHAAVINVMAFYILVWCIRIIHT